MKIDNVLITSNDNPLYSSYWPYTSELWGHFGLCPTLLRITENPNIPFAHPSAFGKIIPLMAIPKAPIVAQALMLGLLAAADTPGINWVTGIDIFPLSIKRIEQVEKLINYLASPQL